LDKVLARRVVGVVSLKQKPCRITQGFLPAPGFTVLASRIISGIRNASFFITIDIHITVAGGDL
jgi:hypothetical protein